MMLKKKQLNNLSQFISGIGIAALIDLFIIVSSYAPLTAQLGTYSFISIAESPYIWGSCKDVTLGEDCDAETREM